MASAEILVEGGGEPSHMKKKVAKSPTHGGKGSTYKEKHSKQTSRWKKIAKRSLNVEKGPPSEEKRSKKAPHGKR